MRCYELVVFGLSAFAVESLEPPDKEFEQISPLGGQLSVTGFACR